MACKTRTRKAQQQRAPLSAPPSALHGQLVRPDWSRILRGHSLATAKHSTGPLSVAVYDRDPRVRPWEGPRSPARGTVDTPDCAPAEQIQLRSGSHQELALEESHIIDQYL